MGRMTPRRTPTTLLLAPLLLVGFGCGPVLTDYKNDERGVIVVDEGEEAPIITNEECATQCNLMTFELDELLDGTNACDFQCGVEIGTSFDGTADLSLLAALLQLEVDGELQVGGACEMTLECRTICQDITLDCMEANPSDPDFVAMCMDQFSDCQNDEVCEYVYGDCIEPVKTILERCLDDYPLDVCQDQYLEASATCSCIYSACVDGGGELECVESPPPLPIAAGPGKWDVPQAFFDAHSQRLAGIGKEAFLVPRVDENQELIGIELGSVSEGDTLYSLGLRNGDVVRGVNGVSAESLVKHPMAALSLLDANQANVAIFRNNSSRVLRYRLVD